MKGLRSSLPVSLVRVVFTVLVGLLLATHPAAAKPTDDFQEHLERGMALYQGGQYEESAKEFQAAYAIRQLPRLLLNLGQVHRKMGHAREALAYYEFYLRIEPNPKPEIKTELEKYISQSKAMIEAAERAKQEFQDQQEAANQDGGGKTPPRSGEPGSPPAPDAAAGGTAKDTAGGTAKDTAGGTANEPAPEPARTAAQKGSGTAATGSAASVAEPAPMLVAQAPPPVKDRPRRRWPIWVGVAGGVLVVGAVIGIAVAATRPHEPVLPVESIR